MHRPCPPPYALHAGALLCLALLCLVPVARAEEAAASAPHPFALSPIMGSSGLSGATLTPSAQITDWGRMELRYDRQIPGLAPNRFGGTDGHNIILGFGLLPNLEVSGRLASNNMHGNCYTEGCGIRDLSANFKVGIPLDAAGRYHLAAGATDLGGQATNFRSYFGVLSYIDHHWLASLGVAQRQSSRNRQGASPLDGPFAHLAYQPLSWARAGIEYTDGDAWANAHLLAPAQWLPQDWRAHVGVSTRLNRNDTTDQAWWNIGLSIPLYRVPSIDAGAKTHTTALATTPTVRTAAPISAPALPPTASVEHTAISQATIPSPAPQPSPETPRHSFQRLPLLGVVPFPGHSSVRALPTDGTVDTPGRDIVPRLNAHEQAYRQAVIPAAAPTQAQQTASSTILPLTVEQAQQLAAALEAQGLEDISIGQTPQGKLLVSINNATYAWNAVDAIGASLAALAQTLGTVPHEYQLVLHQRQLPMAGVAGRTDCLEQWLQNTTPSCNAGQLFSAGSATLAHWFDGAQWLVEQQAASWKTTRLTLNPLLQSRVATEYGVLDYSLGVQLGIEQPLWSGAWIDIRQNIPLDESDDFQNGAAFSSARIQNELDRAILVQTARLPLEEWMPSLAQPAMQPWGLSNVTGQVALGRVDADYTGTVGELRWEPGEGQHRISVLGGYLRKEDDTPRIGRQMTFDRYAQPALLGYRYNHASTRTYLELEGGQFMNSDRGVRAKLKQWFGDVAISFYMQQTSPETSLPSRRFAGMNVSLPLGPRQSMMPGRHIQVQSVPRWAHSIQTLVGNSSNDILSGYGARPGTPTLDSHFNSDRASLLYYEDNIYRIRQVAQQLRRSQ